MQFSDLLEKRYSVRAYQSKAVENEKVVQILEAARLAPTAANYQPFRLFVISTEKHKEALMRIYSRAWFVQAPLVICICAVKSEAWSRRDGKSYADIDATIALDHLILRAADLELGTCWIAAFDPVEARSFLSLTENLEPIAFTPLGYAADVPRPKKRRHLDELVTFL